MVKKAYFEILLVKIVPCKQLKQQQKNQQQHTNAENKRIGISGQAFVQLFSGSNTFTLQRFFKLIRKGQHENCYTFFSYVIVVSVK